MFSGGGPARGEFSNSCENFVLKNTSNEGGDDHERAAPHELQKSFYNFVFSFLGLESRRVCSSAMESFLKRISTKVFEKLGPGYSERVYHNAFEVELRLRGIQYETEKILPIIYEGHTIGNLRADLIINARTVVELKSTTKLKDEFRNQVRNYINLTGLEAGYLVNFPCVTGEVEVECVVRSPMELMPGWLQ